MATKKPKNETTEENDMICTGGIPPQVMQGMEMYQEYMRTIVEFYRAWCYMTGVTYWSELMRDQYMQQQKDNEEE